MGLGFKGLGLMGLGFMGSGFEVRGFGIRGVIIVLITNSTIITITVWFSISMLGWRA